MAKWLGLPVLLVVDARSMARSAAALVQGFENFDPGLRFAGVVFNRLGSERHLRYLREALADTVRMPCLGGFGRDEAVSVPERHLGLVTAEDHPLDAQRLARLARWSRPAWTWTACSPRCRRSQPARSRRRRTPRLVRAGADRGRPGRAFCFYYEDNLELPRALRGASGAVFAAGRPGAAARPRRPVFRRRLPRA